MENFEFSPGAVRFFYNQNQAHFWRLDVEPRDKKRVARP